MATKVRTAPILVGFQFKFIFNDNIGVVNNALQSLGLSDVAIPWLVGRILAMFSIMFAEVWMSTSIFAILLLAGMFAVNVVVFRRHVLAIANVECDYARTDFEPLKAPLHRLFDDRHAGRNRFGNDQVFEMLLGRARLNVVATDA